jgi:hypothetical protein
MHARAGRSALDARMTDVRAARFLTALLARQFILRIKYLRERNEGEWIVEDKLVPVRAEKNRNLSRHEARCIDIFTLNLP